MTSGRRPYVLLTAVAVAVACSGPGSKPGRDARLAQATQRGSARGEALKGPQRRDKPQEARDFYLKKRAPVGTNTIPVERYQAAREQMGRMPLYSTRTGALAPRRAGGVGSAANVAVGTWSPLGPGNIGGRTRAIAINPSSPDIMYSGGVAGGVWKTANGGAAWLPVGDAMANLAVTTIALRPGTPSTILAGTGEGYFNGDAVRGAGVFRSTDSGVSWTQIAEPTSGTTSDFHYINKIVFYDSNTAFAATGSGIYRSINGGQDWSSILDPNLIGGCLDLAVRTDEPTVFASCGTFTQARVYRTTNATDALSSIDWTSYNPSLDGSDTGGSFLTEPQMGRTSLAIAKSNQEVIYAVAAHSQFDYLWAVYYSSDGGESWQTRAPVGSFGFESALLFTNPPFAWPCSAQGFGGTAQYFNQGWYDNTVAVDPLNPDVVWVGGIDIFRSDDGGFNFGLASFWWPDPSEPAYAHADQHTIVFHPQYNGTSNKQVFFGNDGGIFRSVTPDGVVQTGDDICNPPALGTGPVTFTSLNNGYGVTQFYYGAVYPNDRQYIGGTQDNGTIVGSDAAGANAWSEVLGGDGGSVAVDPDNTSILYGEFTGLSLQKSTNGGTSWNDAVTGINDTGFLFIAPFILDPSDSDFLYLGGTYLWRTQNKAVSWQRASASTGSSISAIAVAPSNGNFALFGTENGYIHRNANARAASSSTTWAKVRPRQGFVSSVAFDPYDPNVAYATYTTFGGIHLYKSLNAGATWTEADGPNGLGQPGIPDVPAHSVVVDPTTNDSGTPRRIYVGTDVGVFVSLDGGSTWNQENTQFPNTVTEQLIVSGANLYAFTHGRGVFRVPLTTSNNATIRLDMVAAAQNVPENAGQASVQFKLRTPNHLPTSGITTVNYTITAGTATLTDDFTAVSGSFSIPNATADEATLNVPVANIVNDAFGEPAETFTVNFDPPAGVILTRTSHIVSITNDSPTPDPVGVNILDLGATEGNGPGNTNALVMVQLGYADHPTVTMNFATANGTATAGTDYTAATGTLTLNNGEISKAISVPIAGDACPETAKNFFVNLSNVSATGVLVDGQSAVTINDNDASGTFQLSAPRITVAESAAKAMVTVTRTGGLGGGAANCVGFSLRTQNGSAIAPSDFTAVGPANFFFAAGASSKVVEVPIVNDTQDEPEESFVVELLSTVGPGAALGAQQTQVVSITDNDTAGMLQFSATALTVGEGAGTATLTVSRTGGNTGPLTVDVLTSGTATGGDVDFDALTQLTFNANQTSAPLVVNINPDGDPEGNEAVKFTLANPTLGATLGAKSAATLTITDAQATVFYSAATFSADEGASSAVITVKRAGPLTGTATVDYATSAGSATPGTGGDYNNVTGTLTFAPKISSRTFAVPLLPDFVAEGDETVNLSLNNPIGAVIGTTQPTAVLKIVENDFGGAVSFGAATYAPKEPVNGSATPTKVNVVIKRTGGVAQGATVRLSTVNGTATGGSDFTIVNNKLITFPAGKASLTEVIEILDDATPEGPEAFDLTLSDPQGGASLGLQSESTVTIADNEPVIEFSKAMFTGKEPVGAATTAVANLTLKRTGSTLGPATVDVRVVTGASGGSATLGADFAFAPNPGPVSLPSGKSSVTLPITINQDDFDEGLETVLLQLENAGAAAVGPLSGATLNITDEEPTVQFSLSAYKVSEPGGSTPTNAVITVKRTGNLTSGMNVDYSTSDDTATAGQDYTAIPTTTLNFPKNVASKTFTVQLLPDLNDEPEETFRVTLSNPAAGSLGTPFQVDVKIRDNDVAGKLQFQTAVSSVSEDGGTVSLTVTRTAGTGLATVNYATVSGVGTGGANSGTDFDMTTGTLTFNPGENSKTFTVNIDGSDGLVEGGEYFTVVLSNPGNGATLGTVVTATVWIVDGD